MQRKVIQITVSEEQHQQLRKISDEDKRSMAAEMRWLIEEEHNRRYPKPSAISRYA